MQNMTKRIIVISLLLITFAITAICVRVGTQEESSQNYIFGGLINQNSIVKDISLYDASLSRQTISVINERISNLNETYFRPSKLKTLNNNFIDSNTFSETFKNGTVPPSLMDSPGNSATNYFSVLQQAANLTISKAGGCGTIGYAQVPYPIAYDFLSGSNKKSMPYDEYLTSFEGIGHINLIKMLPIITDETDRYKYFIELEILEGTSVGATTFSYYTGELDLIKVNGLYYIDSLSLTPEDFFCAAYHGWAHNAESYVEIVYGNWCGLIMKQYAPQQDDYEKNIIVDGIDNKKYMFEFAKLTNGTDLLINSLIKSNENWVPVEIDVDKFLDKLKPK
ncbi:MAG TPA: hypothetical protein VIK78_18940 [Ruminiclostridium sp.]